MDLPEEVLDDLRARLRRIGGQVDCELLKLLYAAAAEEDGRGMGQQGPGERDRQQVGKVFQAVPVHIAFRAGDAVVLKALRAGGIEPARSQGSLQPGACVDVGRRRCGQQVGSR